MSSIVLHSCVPSPFVLPAFVRMPRLQTSLKARIALITTVLAAVLGTGIVLGSLYYAHRDLEDALQNQQDSIVKLSADQLDTAMDDRIVMLAHMAPQIGAVLESAHGRAREDVRADLLDVIGKTIPVPAAFNSVVVTDANGSVLTSSGPPIEVGDRDYFREAVRTLNPVVDAPIHARVDGTIGVLVAMPVVSASRQFLGLVGGWGSICRARTSWSRSPIAGWATPGSIAWCRQAPSRSTCSIRTPVRHTSRPAPWVTPAARRTSPRRSNS